jgi:kynurenine formamidase
VTQVDPLIDLVARGIVVFDLARPMVAGMPQSPNHPRFSLSMPRRHGDVERADGSSAANDLLVTGTHVGTHIDALGHVSHQGRLHGDVDAAGAQRGGILSTHGVDEIAPMICPGLLLDVPVALGLETCEPGYEITPADLDAALELVGMPPPPGAVLLVRSGWGRRFEDSDAYLGHASGVPGVGEAGAQWLASHRPKAVGADSVAFECIRPGVGHALLPVHRRLLVQEGVHIVETLALEELAAAAVRSFVFVLAPLFLVGATGSPVRPLAVVSTARTQQATDAGGGRS